MPCERRTDMSKPESQSLPDKHAAIQVAAVAYVAAVNAYKTAPTIRETLKAAWVLRKRRKKLVKLLQNL